MKKFLVWFILLIVLISSVYSEGVKEIQPVGIDWPLTIIHTNDNHSHLDVDYKGRYGAAKVSYMAKQVRGVMDNVLFLNAGDFVMGTVFYTVFEGTADRDVMNMMDYDAMTLGNHEFDKGMEGLSKFITGLETPVISTNVNFDREPGIKKFIKEYLIKEIGGRKVAILGATIPETPTISSPGANIVFEDVAEAVQPVIDDLENQGIDIVVLISHNGFLHDQAIAAAVDGIDIIVGGHSHTELLGADYPTLIQSKSNEPVVIVQANEANKYLGNLTVNFDTEGVASSWWGAPIKMSASVPQDKAIAAYLAEKNVALKPFTGAVLGTNKTELIRSRTEESNIGNLIADAMLAAVKDKGVQVALTNGGGIRADIGTGEITMQKLMEVLPFGNLVATFEIKGSDLWQVFDHGVNRVEEGSGRFLSMSGAKIVWDPSKPPFDYAAQTGGRITAVSISDGKGGWNPLDPNAVYKVAANNYIRGGGDDFKVLKEKAIDPYDAGALDLDVMTEFFKANSPIDYKTEGRIRRVSE
jgi:5'-nucleotidase / UDP-sugar diphosphatase